MPQRTNLIPLIDADLLLYRCGFSADAQAKKEFGDPDYEMEDYTSWALSTTRTTIEGILMQFPDSKEFKLYVSGAGNFREQIASILPYKGNRDPSHRPKYYKEIKDYLTGYWEAEVVDGREADDALGCEQWKNPNRSTCIVSIDKDLLMIPGHHYNWVKQEFVDVSLNDANLHFYRQMLEGDRTDNIPGITGVGVKTVDKLFKECAGDLTAVKTKVLEYYDKQYGQQAGSAYDEVASLLFIQREEGKTYKDYGL